MTEFRVRLHEPKPKEPETPWLVGIRFDALGKHYADYAVEGKELTARRLNVLALRGRFNDIQQRVVNAPASFTREQVFRVVDNLSRKRALALPLPGFETSSKAPEAAGAGRPASRTARRSA